MYHFLQPTGKARPTIPDEDRLRALVEHHTTGRDLAEIAQELYSAHGLEAPKYAAQGFSAFKRRFRRLVEAGDSDAIAMCERIGKELGAESAADDE